MNPRDEVSPDRADHAELPFEVGYRRLVEYTGGGQDPTDPADVLAMQMVLRIEKNDPPSRLDLLEAAARAVVLLCLDTRQEWAAPLDLWCGARIRKIARRARGAHWQAAQEVPGTTASTGDAWARALVPGRVGDVDRRISRLQIGGTDIPGDLAAASAPGLCLWINPTLDMTVGKLAAQVGHASMLAVGLMTLETAENWYRDGCALSVRVASQERWADLRAAAQTGTAVAVRDAGFTEIAPGSVTVIAALD